MANFVELVMEQGATFSHTVSLKNSDGSAQNLANTICVSKMRTSYYSANSTTLSCSIPTPNNGNVIIAMTAANTANVRPGVYVFDAMLTDNSSGTITKIIEGNITVAPSVTKD